MDLADYIVTTRTLVPPPEEAGDWEREVPNRGISVHVRFVLATFSMPRHRFVSGTRLFSNVMQHGSQLII
jgi:hypothetical protein